MTSCYQLNPVKWPRSFAICCCSGIERRKYIENLDWPFERFVVGLFLFFFKEFSFYSQNNSNVHKFLYFALCRRGIHQYGLSNYELWNFKSWSNGSVPFLEPTDLWHHCRLGSSAYIHNFTDLVSVLSLDRRFFYFSVLLPFCFVLHEFSELNVSGNIRQMGKKLNMHYIQSKSHFIYFLRRF